jgi:hypothetical protein
MALKKPKSVGKKIFNYGQTCRNDDTKHRTKAFAILRVVLSF